MVEELVVCALLNFEPFGSLRAVGFWGVQTVTG